MRIDPRAAAAMTNQQINDLSRQYMTPRFKPAAPGRPGAGVFNSVDRPLATPNLPKGSMTPVRSDQLPGGPRTAPSYAPPSDIVPRGSTTPLTYDPQYAMPGIHPMGPGAHQMGQPMGPLQGMSTFGPQPQGFMGMGLGSMMGRGRMPFGLQNIRTSFMDCSGMGGRSPQKPGYGSFMSGKGGSQNVK